MRLFMKTESGITDILDNEALEGQFPIKEQLENYLLYLGMRLDKDAVIDVVQHDAKEQRKIAGELHSHATKGQKWADNLAQAITKQSEIMASIVTMTPEQIIDVSANLAKLGKVIASEGKTGFTVGDDGKIALKGAGKSGSGNRSNPLPPHRGCRLDYQGR